MLRKILFISAMLTSSYSFGQDSTIIFESTKGKWDFPVATVYGIDTVPGSCLDCHGDLTFTIKSQPAATVHAIQGGHTASVFEIEGEYIVMIRTGRYFIVYCNLSRPSATKGSYITKGTSIGNLINIDLDLILI